MRRLALLLSVTFAMGIAVGWFAVKGVSGYAEPVKRSTCHQGRRTTRRTPVRRRKPKPWSCTLERRTSPWLCPCNRPDLRFDHVLTGALEYAWSIFSSRAGKNGLRRHDHS